MELSRAEKNKRTRLANIIKNNPGISIAEAERLRIEQLKEQGSRGGRAATGESKIRGGTEYYRTIGTLGGKSRGKNKEL